MPIRVAERLPPRLTWHGVRRLAVAASASLLMLVGLASAALLVCLVLFTLLDAGRRPSAPPDDTETLALLCGLLALSLASLAGGTRLLRGRRHLVLFLRRFGFSGASAMATHAAGTAMSGRWRMLTLDDEELAPVGPPHRWRRIARVGLVTSALAAAAGGILLFSGATDLRRRAPVAHPALADVIQHVGLSIVDGVVALSLLLEATALVACFGTLGLHALIVLRSVRHAESVKAMDIEDEAAIAGALAVMILRSRRFIAPRLVVARVADAAWRRSVTDFAASVSAVLIDVSNVSTNLAWEIETLAPSMRSRWILIAEDRPDPWFASDPARLSPEEQSALMLLDGEKVLVYAPDGRDRREFARQLRARLDELESERDARIT